MIQPPLRDVPNFTAYKTAIALNVLELSSILALKIDATEESNGVNLWDKLKEVVIKAYNIIESDLENPP